jgi:nucleolar protein 9
VRPRRLEADNLSYLKEVTEMVTQPNEDTGDEEVELLLWNVLEELAPRAASAASDRHAGELIEVLFPKMSDAQMRFFLSKMLGYVSHLWTNRYSSHVLQNLLSRASAIVEKEATGDADDSLSEDDAERLKDTPSMGETIVAMAKEVEIEWLTLMNDVSASHVMRSLLAVLAGRPLVPEKRGKNAKHRVVTFGEARASKDGSVVTYAVPESFDELFQSILMVLRSCHTEQLSNLLYDKNSGPLIATALKLAPTKSRKALTKHILQWEDEEASARVFYDLSSDPVTSHLLESMFESSEDKFFVRVYHRCLRGKLVEFCEHNISNYVVQNAIQRVPTKELAVEVLSELKDALWTVLSMGRPGVIWRLTELCVKFQLEQEEVFSLLVHAVKKQESKKPEAVRKEFVAALLGLQLSTGGNSKLQLNVMGARIIEQLMKFEPVEYMQPLYKGILELNTVQLVALAKDSTGSRCLIEPIWEGEDERTSWAIEALYQRFVGHFGALAMDRLGAFSVMKCFDKLSLAHKEVVVQELLQVEAKLSGSHFSQLVMNACNLFEYKKNRERWAALYQKQQKIAELFKDVVEQEDSGAKADKKSDKKAAKKKRKAAAIASAEHTDGPQDGADVTSIMDALRKDKSVATDKKKEKKKKSKKLKREEEADA